MAIALQPKYPVPDRSKQKVNLVKDEDGVLDIGWCDGVMSDGRPFRAEMWAQEGVSALTIFFSTVGLDQADDAAAVQLVLSERLVTMRPGAEDRISAKVWTDDAGHSVWSVNVVVGYDDEEFTAGSVPLFPFSRTGEPNTLFNPVPITVAHQRSKT